MANDLLHSFANTIPTISKSRSVFNRDYDHITSFNLGEVVPFYLDEVLPGDTVNINTSLVARLTSLVRPVFGNIVLDTYYFFVPTRLTWEHWQAFWGENDQNAWTIDLPAYTVPQLTAPANGWQKGTLADHFGLPVGVKGISVNALPFRAFTLIYNEFFRDENVQRPYLYSKGDATRPGSNMSDYTSLIAGGQLPFANKFKDYFTSALPQPQKGDPVTIEFINSGLVPVVANNNFIHNTEQNILFGSSGHNLDESGKYYLSLVGDTHSTEGILHTDIETQGTPAGLSAIDQTNLVARIDGSEAITVNALRYAFALQRALEHLALSGSRYIEVLKGLYGVNCPDYRLQRPEYLGGDRVPIQIQQVAQTSATSENSPAANLTAYSHTADSGHSFVKSFTEHGYLIGIAVARLNHVYGSQGINKMWTRTQRFEFYTPTFANIGEQPIYKKELVATGNDSDNEVFGYQEAWADYRYKPSEVTGSIRPESGSDFLPSWSTTDYYESVPVLNEDFLKEEPAFLDRALAYSHEVADQFVVDFYVKGQWSRLMPLYSVPGLIDHN